MIKVVNIAGREITVDEELNTIARIFKSGIIEVSPQFETLNVFEQDFILTQLEYLKNSTKLGQGEKFREADELAIERMITKYPHKTRLYWYKVFMKVIDLVPLTEFNVKRAHAFKDKIKNDGPK